MRVCLRLSCLVLSCPVLACLSVCQSVCMSLFASAGALLSPMMYDVCGHVHLSSGYCMGCKESCRWAPLKASVRRHSGPPKRGPLKWGRLSGRGGFAPPQGLGGGFNRRCIEYVSPIYQGFSLTASTIRMDPVSAAHTPYKAASGRALATPAGV